MTVNARPRHRAAALAAVTAAATVLGVTAYAPSTAHAAPAAPAAPAAGIPLTDGTLDWGIKKSFRDYLTGPIADGKITVADGAETNADGSFRFTDGKGSYETGTHAVDTSFQGSVHLYGHKGALDIKLSDLKLVTKGKGGSLSADVATPKEKKNDVELAALDLSGVQPGQGEDGEMTFADIPATLTEGGSDAFEGYYKKGEKLDPVSLAVRADSGGGTGGSGTGGTGGTDSTGGTGGTGSSGSSGSSGGSSAEPGGEPGGSGGGTSASGAVVDGNLDWGVKKSFRDYVTGPIANGKVELSGGAKKTGAGYRFPKGSGAAGKGSLDAAFQGGVRFLGHKESGSYVLDLTFSQLKVKANGTKGSLVSDVKAKDRESGKVSTYDNLTVAALKLPSGALDAKKDVVTVKEAPATLTKSGAKAFGGFYKAGDKLDPVTASVSLDENAKLPGANGSSGSGSGSGSGPGSGDAGGAAAGDGAAGSGGAGTVGGGSGDAGSDLGAHGALASTGADVPSMALMGGAAALAALGGAAVYSARRRGGRIEAES